MHIIGKDILRFHALHWPAFLMAAKIPLPLRVLVTIFRQKEMLKSLHILDPIEIINKYGIDQLWYYLIKKYRLNMEISLENLENCINNDLANNYGNLCQRVFTF